jgi:hypothetical protein
MALVDKDGMFYGGKHNNQSTNYRYEHVSRKLRVGTVQYFEWLEGFTTSKKHIGIDLVPVTIGQ